MSEYYRLQKAKDSFQITVPAQLVRSKGWEKSEELKWEVNSDGNLVLKEK